MALVIAREHGKRSRVSLVTVAQCNWMLAVREYVCFV